MGEIFRQYSWAFNVAILLLCSFFLAKIVGVTIASRLEVERSVGVLRETPPPVLPQRVMDANKYQVIVERNVFDSTERAAPTAGGEGADMEEILTGEAVRTSLGITVLGVLVVGEGMDRRSSATVSSGKDTGVYAVGDVESFAPNTKLTRVAPDRIEFLNNGRLEYAEVGTAFGESIFSAPKDDRTVALATPSETTSGGESKIKMETPGTYVIDQSEVDNALQNLDSLYTDIRAVPNFAGGKVSGMKILSVKNGSLFAKLGLTRGDVLERINGMELDVKQGFSIFNQLKDAKHLTVDLIRQGQPTTMEYEIR